MPGIVSEKPRPFSGRGLPFDRGLHYLLPRFDAFNGLIFVFAEAASAAMWEAMLQFPFFHFREGSGQAVQYQALESSLVRLQPLHCSTISWQIPPL